MDNREVLLEVKNVSKIYGDLHALKEVSFQVRKGEWVAIMGSSGSGKSTMMNIIGCMDKPSVGEVILDGQDITKESQNSLTKIRREKIGLIFQQFHLIPYLTALENVMVAQYYHSIPDEQEALQALERVGLKDRAKHLPSQLSGGEQQRVCIARALINSPEIILADEPTGNLDEVNEKIVIDILTQLHEEGSTIIVVTHDLEVGDVAERKIILEYGKIVNASLNEDMEKNFCIYVSRRDEKNYKHSDEEVLEKVWGYGYAGKTNIVDVYVRYLRSKIDEKESSF